MATTRKAIPSYVKNEVLARQNYKCNICLERLVTTYDGIQLWDYDHIVEHAKTQDDSIENLQAIHLECHRIKTVRQARNHAPKQRTRKRLKTSIVNLQTNPFHKFEYIDTPSEYEPSRAVNIQIMKSKNDSTNTTTINANPGPLVQE